MPNRKGYGGLSGGIMSKQFGAFLFFNLFPTEERGAPEPIPGDPATDLELAFGGLAPSSRAQQIGAQGSGCLEAGPSGR